MALIEYRVRPVTRYVVTRFENQGNGTGGSRCLGEFDRDDTAYEVGYALCKAEHERLGWALDDERICYPCPTPFGAVRDQPQPPPLRA